MVRLQDDFYDYVNGMGWDSCIPDDKPTTMVLWTWSKISKTWCWILLGMAKRRRIAEDSILAKTCQIPQNGGRFGYDGKQLVPAMPLINEIKAYLPWRLYQQVGHLWASCLCHLACHQTYGMPKMNVLCEKAGLILPDTTYYEEDNEKVTRVISYLRSNGWKTWQNWFLREEIKDILDSHCGWCRIGQICLVKRRKSEYNKSYHPYEWADCCLIELLSLILSLQKWRTNARYYRARRAFLGRNSPTFYSAANWGTLLHAKIETWCCLDWRLSDGRNCVCLVNMDEWGFQNPSKRKQLWPGRRTYSQAIGLWYGRKGQK